LDIRPAIKEDAGDISELVIASTTKYVLPDMSIPVAKSLLKTMDVAGIEKNMQYGIIYRLAECDGQLLGLLGMKNHKHIYHLFVDERYHRQGIAKQLWNETRQACIDAGFSENYTVNSSLYAQVIYENLGFVATRRGRQHQGTTTVPMKYKL